MRKMLLTTVSMAVISAAVVFAASESAQEHSNPTHADKLLTQIDRNLVDGFGAIKFSTQSVARGKLDEAENQLAELAELTLSDEQREEYFEMTQVLAVLSQQVEAMQPIDVSSDDDIIVTSIQD